MLDTRMWARDLQAAYAPDVGEPSQWSDPERTLLGDVQEVWLLEELDASRERGTIWRFIGNQIIFSPTRDPLSAGDILYADFWDGYQAQRTRIVEHVLANGVDNLVFLTGDIHTSWAIELASDPFDPERYDPATGEGAYAVELVGPAITSQALENDPAQAAVATSLLVNVNPQVKFSDVTRKGYVLLDVTPERVQAEWYFVLDIKRPNMHEEELARVFVCRAGQPHLVPGEQASASRTNAPVLAPEA